MSAKRQEGETFSDYKIRRQIERKISKKHLRGRRVQFTSKEIQKIKPVALG